MTLTPLPVKTSLKGFCPPLCTWVHISKTTHCQFLHVFTLNFFNKVSFESYYDVLVRKVLVLLKITCRHLYISLVWKKSDTSISMQDGIWGISSETGIITAESFSLYMWLSLNKRQAKNYLWQ